MVQCYMIWAVAAKYKIGNLNFVVALTVLHNNNNVPSAFASWLKQGKYKQDI